MVRDFHVILSDFVNLIMLSIIVRDYFLMMRVCPMTLSDCVT